MRLNIWGRGTDTSMVISRLSILALPEGNCRCRDRKSLDPGFNQLE